MRRAELNASAVCFTQTLRVLFQGFRNAMNLPSGESCAPEISGSPKSRSRSMIGGRVPGGRVPGGRVPGGRVPGGSIRDLNLADFGVPGESHLRFLKGRPHLVA